MGKSKGSSTPQAPASFDMSPILGAFGGMMQGMMQGQSQMMQMMMAMQQQSQQYMMEAMAPSQWDLLADPQAPEDANIPETDEQIAAKAAADQAIKEAAKHSYDDTVHTTLVDDEDQPEDILA